MKSLVGTDGLAMMAPFDPYVQGSRRRETALCLIMVDMEPDGYDLAYVPTLRATVMIATTDEPGGYPNVGWTTELTIPVPERDALVAQVRSLVSGPRHVPHTFRYDGGQTSWGGAGEEFYNVLVYVADHAVDAAFGGVVGALFGSLQARFGQGNTRSERPLTRGEAVEYARRSIVTSYRGVDRRGPLDAEALELVSEEQHVKTGEWTIRFRAGSGDVFEVHLAMEEGFPVVARMRRKRRSS